jgi:CRP-like cAMP-binding protein
VTQLRETMREDAALSNSLLAAATRRALQLLDRFDDTARLGTTERLARLLFRLGGGQPGGPAGALIVDVRQQELADMAFTTVPTVSRILGRWEAQGLVTRQRGQVVVHRPAALAEVAGLEVD